MFIIRKATSKDIISWLGLRMELWPHCSEEKHLSEINDYLVLPGKCTLIACNEANALVGFCECSLRYDYVEGATSSPTVYLEGIFVTEQFRKLGIAAELIKRAENWGKENGCLEMGSDAEIANQSSIDMHLRLGFKEKNRVVHFIKPIS